MPPLFVFANQLTTQQQQNMMASEPSVKTIENNLHHSDALDHKVFDAADSLTQLRYGHFYDPVRNLAGQALKDCVASWKHRNIDLGYHNRYQQMNDELFDYVWNDLFRHLTSCVTFRMREIVKRQSQNVKKEIGMLYQHKTGISPMEAHVKFQIMLFKYIFKDVFRAYCADKQQLKHCCGIVMVNMNNIHKDVWNSISEEIIDTLKAVFDKYLLVQDGQEFKC